MCKITWVVNVCVGVKYIWQVSQWSVEQSCMLVCMPHTLQHHVGETQWETHNYCRKNPQSWWENCKDADNHRLKIIYDFFLMNAEEPCDEAGNINWLERNWKMNTMYHQCCAVLFESRPVSSVFLDYENKKFC